MNVFPFHLKNGGHHSLILHFLSTKSQWFASFAPSLLWSHLFPLGSRLPLWHPQGRRSCNHPLSLILWTCLSLLDYSCHCMVRPNSVSPYIKKTGLHQGHMNSGCFLQASTLSTEVLKGSSVLAVSMSSLQVISSRHNSAQAFSSQSHWFILLGWTQWSILISCPTYPTSLLYN